MTLQANPVCFATLCTNEGTHRRYWYVQNGPGLHDVERVPVWLCADCARQSDKQYPDADKFY